MIVSYLKQLEDEAKARNVRLLDAFKAGDVPTSTYYRAVNRNFEIRQATAEKVMGAIYRLSQEDTSHGEKTAA